ncbi:TetR/AcrR family transcriptional regulator [Sphingosinicella soli]|uniref:AcrR family transcriptional regulator n=1 Tax=Sphingosinicella soli TaxID=333708 RepID=A0A7W7B068_9SPHN|nr:TetR/AcrR family transcriptional regulator [Sphingosinicella soli]MBB4631439.1 AcrR family transcriptional regulator [Sphingosinicella soli]
MNVEPEQLDAPRMTQDERRTIRRQAILDAAEALFLENGYPFVSLSAIVQQSGGSLATIYQMFGNKQGLLRAVVDRSSDESLKELETLFTSKQSPRRILEAFAVGYLAFVASPRAIAFLRLVIAESLTDPAFGAAFDRDMQTRFVARMATLFERWNTERRARIDRPWQAAELYFAILMCNVPVRSLLGKPPGGTSREDIIWRLACFLDHFGFEDDAPSVGAQSARSQTRA